VKFDETTCAVRTASAFSNSIPLEVSPGGESEDPPGRAVMVTEPPTVTVPALGAAIT